MTTIDNYQFEIPADENPFGAHILGVATITVTTYPQSRSWDFEGDTPDIGLEVDIEEILNDDGEVTVLHEKDYKVLNEVVASILGDAYADRGTRHYYFKK